MRFCFHFSSVSKETCTLFQFPNSSARPLVQDLQGLWRPVLPPKPNTHLESKKWLIWKLKRDFFLENVAGICGIFFSSTGRSGRRCFSWSHQFGKELLSTLSFPRKARGICSTTWPVIRKGMSLFALWLKLDGKCLLIREQNDVVWLLVYDLVSIWILLRTLVLGETRP